MQSICILYVQQSKHLFKLIFARLIVLSVEHCESVRCRSQAYVLVFYIVAQSVI
jgi:hypothetical protein